MNKPSVGRISVAKLRSELAAHEREAQGTATLGVPLLLALLDAVEAAHAWETFTLATPASASDIHGNLIDVLDRFDFE